MYCRRHACGIYFKKHERTTNHISYSKTGGGEEKHKLWQKILKLKK